MSIREIFCQDRAIDILQRAFAAGKFAHAYIFAGHEGVGKFKTACEWAKLLLCRQPAVKTEDANFADSCGRCESCRLFEADSHPDFSHIYKELLEFTKEGRSKTTPVDLSIDVIREFLIEKVSQKPTLSERKVFVVSEAERLNASSQNALLKVLEEPPCFCSIILLCTQTDRLLPTIKSRCQIIRFGPIAEEKIIEKVKQTGLDAKQAQYLARLADGSIGRACQWARLQLADAGLYQSKTELINSLIECKPAEVLDLAGHCLDVSKKIASVWGKIEADTSKTDINRRAAKTVIQIIISALRDAMKLNVGGDGNPVNFDQPGQIKKMADRLDVESAAQRVIDACKSMQWIGSAVNERLIFEHLLLNLLISDTMPV